MYRQHSVSARRLVRVSSFSRRVALAAALLLTPAALAHAQSARLRWDAPANGSQLAYVVERGTAKGTYTASFTVPVGVTTYDATGLTLGVPYYFVVRAVDASGLRSAASNEITVLLSNAPPPPPPPAPEPAPEPTPQPAPEPTPAPAPAPTEPAITPVTIPIASEAALQQAVATLVSNTVLELAPGSYRLTRPLVLRGDVQDVTLRSSTGDESSVVIYGPAATAATPMPDAIVATRVTRLTLANLTIRDTPGFAIVLGDGVQQPRLQGLWLVDNGQFVLSALHASGAGAVGGIVDGCGFEYTGQASNLPSGLDIRGGRDWVIRRNFFVDPVPKTTVTFGPAVHAWQGSAGTVVERNTFVNTTREIVFGLANRTPNQHTGGVVRNNMVTRRAATGQRGAAISVLDSPGTVVANNSALLAGTSSVAIDYAHPDTRDVYIVNNLLDGAIVARDYASALLRNNVVNATATLFVAPAAGDLRLREDTARYIAIDHGIAVAGVEVDHEGQRRPARWAMDIGADEVP